MRKPEFSTVWHTNFIPPDRYRGKCVECGKDVYGNSPWMVDDNKGECGPVCNNHPDLLASKKRGLADLTMFYSYGSSTHRERFGAWNRGEINGNPPPLPEDESKTTFSNASKDETTLTLQYIDAVHDKIREAEKGTITKEQLLSEFMERQGANPETHLLILPESARGTLNRYRGELPDFAKFSAYVRNCYILEKEFL